MSRVIDSSRVWGYKSKCVNDRNVSYDKTSKTSGSIEANDEEETVKKENVKTHTH